MKKHQILYVIAIVFFTAGCSSNSQSNDNLPSIDVRKNYPEKEIMLTDIADVTYVHLNTTDEDYLYKGSLLHVTENTLVMSDESSVSILFFSKDGNPKSRFNRFGSGPEEYTQKRLMQIIYDESTDDVFLLSLAYNPRSIPVYSSTGEFKRRLILPKEVMPFPIVDFDDQSLLMYDLQKQLSGVKSEYQSQSCREIDIIPQAVNTSYYHISKTDGAVLEYVEILSNEADFMRPVDGGRGGIPIFNRIAKGADGLFVCDIETDTVFLYNKNKTLIPIICKTPLINDLDPKIILVDFMEAGKYQFMFVYTMISREERMKIPRDELYKHYNRHYLRDKQTGEIFHQKIRCPDYTEKDFFITARNMFFTGKETLAYFELDLFELKKASQENKLNGKLKELVASLDEMNDNNVLMFATFK